jgi:hypothetical protein
MAVVTVTGTGLNLATAANNFTVAIINHLGASTQYATSVSRTSLISGYNVTVNPGDVTIRVTSTGVCSSSADINISIEALQSYRPDPIEASTYGASPESFIAAGGRDGGGGSYEVIIGETDVYSFMSETDFTVTHVSTSGGLSTGAFLAGTLGARIIGSTTLQMFGMTRNSYTPDQSINTSAYRLTYTPSGLSRDVNFYWFVE